MGYDYKVATKATFNGRHPSWEKIKLLLDNWDRYDIIWCIDADIWINKYDKVEQLSDIFGAKKPLAISVNGLNGDSQGYIVSLNCGSILASPYLDNDGEAYRLLEQVWDAAGKYAQEWPWEQAVINDKFHKQTNVRNLILALPMRTINSWWQDTPKNAPDNFVYHLMARSNTDRVSFIKEHLL
jgi:hypothetical protein